MQQTGHLHQSHFCQQTPPALDHSDSCEGNCSIKAIPPAAQELHYRENLVLWWLCASDILQQVGIRAHCMQTGSVFWVCHCEERQRIQERKTLSGIESRQMWTLMGSLPQRIPKFPPSLFSAILKCQYTADVQSWDRRNISALKWRICKETTMFLECPIKDVTGKANAVHPAENPTWEQQKAPTKPQKEQKLPEYSWQLWSFYKIL